MRKLLICMVSVITMLFTTSCKKEYTITVQSNNTAYGTVSGGGDYKEGKTATLTATPNGGYRFVSWQDNNKENPRKVEVTGDAVYIATFGAANPAEDFVGAYTIQATAHATLPVVGNFNYPFDDSEAIINLLGDEGDVTITMMGQTETAHVTSSGMIVEPMVIPIPFNGNTYQFTATFPTIPAPVNGVSQFTVQISATTQFGTIPGTIDVIATRQ